MHVFQKDDVPVAQLDRATGYGPVGRGFEPLQARQSYDGRVAQLVEQGTENPRVTGSTPVLATILSSLCFATQAFFFSTHEIRAGFSYRRPYFRHSVSARLANSAILLCFLGTRLCHLPN